MNTVHKIKCVVAQKGQRCVAAATSGERGTNVTLTMAVSAAGEKIPPFLIYPRVHMQDKYVMHGSADAKGVANGSGWQTADTFVQFLHHFKQYAIKAGTESTLLILDNHESHMNIAGLDFCKENNIDVLTLPPHTSHKLQPLDKGVFGPLKTYYENACKAWMFNHPNIPINIENIAELVAEPILKGASSMNIISGFRATGIWPFNRDIFTEDDFLASSVTDRPYEDEAVASTSDAAIPTPLSESAVEELMQLDIGANVEVSSDISSLSLSISLDDIRPLPRAAARKASTRARKRRKAALLTGPVMMEALRVEQEATAQKKAAQANRKQSSAARKIDKEVAKRQKATEKAAKIAEKAVKIAEKAAKIAEKATKRPKSGRRRAGKRSSEPDWSSDEEIEDLCCECHTKVPNDASKRMCVKCSVFAHQKCAGKTVIYKCTSCMSDSGDDDDTSEVILKHQTEHRR